jgi:hypothetical protein
MCRYPWKWRRHSASQTIEAIADDAIDALDAGRCEHFRKLICNCSYHDTSLRTNASGSQSALGLRRHLRQAILEAIRKTSRSSGAMTFNTGNYTSAIPVGLGLGKVIQLDGGYTLNIYAEAQPSLYRSGVGAPN